MQEKTVMIKFDKKQWSKQYYENNKEEAKQYYKQYNEDYKEQLKQKSKQYYETHKEERKQYREDHKEEIKQKDKQYYEDHKEYYLIRMNERRRFIRTDIILNQSFPESNLHHPRNGVGIYIPGDLHRSVSHCLKTGHNMNTINDKVDLWLNENSIQVIKV